MGRSSWVESWDSRACPVTSSRHCLLGQVLQDHVHVCRGVSPARVPVEGPAGKRGQRPLSIGLPGREMAEKFLFVWDFGGVHWGRERGTVSRGEGPTSPQAQKWDRQGSVTEWQIVCCGPSTSLLLLFSHSLLSSHEPVSSS